MADQKFNPQPIQSTTNNNRKGRYNNSNNYKSNNYYQNKSNYNGNNQFHWRPDESDDQTPQQSETPPAQPPPQSNSNTNQQQQQQSPPQQQPPQEVPQQPQPLNQKHNAFDIQKDGGHQNYQNRNNRTNRGGYNGNRNNQYNGNRNNQYNGNRNNQYNGNRNGYNRNRNNRNQYENRRPRNNSNNNNYQQDTNSDQQYSNDAVKKILCIMSDEVSSSTPIEDVLGMQNIGADLIRNPPYDGELLSESLSPMNVPMNLVDFLVEGLAVNQPEKLRFQANKQFPELTVLEMNLPVRTPISFLTPDQPDKTQLGFYNTKSLTAERSQTLAADVLNTISNRRKIVYRISNVKKNSFSNQELSDFTRECEVVVLRDNINSDGDLISFELHVLQYDFTQDKKNKVDQFIGKMYKAGENQNSTIDRNEESVYVFDV